MVFIFTRQMQILTGRDQYTPSSVKGNTGIVVGGKQAFNIRYDDVVPFW